MNNNKLHIRQENNNHWAKLQEWTTVTAMRYVKEAVGKVTRSNSVGDAFTDIASEHNVCTEQPQLVAKKPQMLCPTSGGH